MTNERSPLGLILSICISILIVVQLWEAVSRVVPPFFLASPAAVLAAYVKLLLDDQLQAHILATLTCFAAALVPAMVVGLAFGAALGAARSVRFIVGPLFSALAAAPLVVLAPLILLWFGVDRTSTILAGFVVAVFPIIDKVRTRLASALERPTIHAAGPQTAAQAPRLNFFAIMLAGWRAGIVPCMSGVVVTELVGSTAGLGHLLLESTMVFNLPNALVAILLIAFPCFMMVKVLQSMEEAVAGVPSGHATK